MEVIMRYYKTISDGYILGIGTGSGGAEITEAEYSTILSAIHSKPADTDTVGYRLTVGMEWETYDIEPPTDEDVTDADIAQALGGIV